MASSKAPSLGQRLLEYDCFPEFSAFVRRSIYHPLGVLVLVGLAAVCCGLFLHAQGFVLAGGVAAVIVGGLFWPGLALRGVRADLAFPQDRASVGEVVPVGWKLENRWPWPVWGIALRGGFSVGKDAVAGVAHLPRRRRATATWNWTPDRRGHYPIQPPEVTTAFPFGLYDHRRIVNVPQSLIVWPTIYEVGPLPLASTDRLLDGAVARNKVGTSGDILGVRPYRRGDSPRRIHWAQSAKHDRLIVCEVQANTRPIAQLWLDLPATGPRETLITIAASFAAGWLGDGAQVGLTFSKTHLPPQAGPAQRLLLLDALAGIPDDVSSTLDELLLNSDSRADLVGLQFIITTASRAEQWLKDCAAAELERWVILAENDEIVPDRVRTAAWLLIANRNELSTQLKAGWAEARHGS
ncbi:MAG: DUF58 domain-containing protein [Gemmataceae bacterium]